MRLVKFNGTNLPKVRKLAQRHLGETSLDMGYVFVDKKGAVLGYTILKPETNHIKIDWIYAKPGYGTEFLHRLERILFKKYDKIVLNVSIDPTERKESVMRRINFYIKNDYRVFDIVFRKKYGPLLKMQKKRQ